MTERMGESPVGHSLPEMGRGENRAPISLCLGCAKPLLNRRKGALYHDDNCKRIYKRLSARANRIAGDNSPESVANIRVEKARRKTYPKGLYRPFVAIDGEGENLKSGEHIYTVLAASSGHCISTKKGLTTEQCLEFLLNLPRGSKSGVRPIYVWFAFDYDVNMMLKDIPLKGKDSIETLRETGKLYWHGFTIRYIRRKIFRLSGFGRVHTSYDVWGFFQSTFETACADWNVPVSSIIAEGKAARSGFRTWTLKRIRDYNRAELSALVELCEKLRASINPLQLSITSWHGPAALATAWLRKNKVHEWLTDVPPSLFEVATRGYFGGRIDVLGYGFVSPVFHYDIVSAYPASTQKLPQMTNLKWKRHGKGLPKLGALYISRIQWEIPDTYWAPFPWRNHDGIIRYPLAGEGWYWKPEIEVALEKFGSKYFKIKESWIAEPVPGTDIEYPFSTLIPETFEYRKELKAKGDPSHVAVKLILNSLYGKFAQTVGKARYYNPVWAGLITSYTRAQLLQAITDSVVCVMTDSLWSMDELDLELGTGLGQWEQQEERSMVLAEAGLYEATAADGSVSVWQRGFDKRNPVDIADIVQRWLNDNYEQDDIFTVNRFVGMGLASVTHLPWCQWVDIDRKINPVSVFGTTKRWPRSTTTFLRKNGGTIFVPMDLWPADSDAISAPYSKAILDPALLADILQDETSEEE